MFESKRILVTGGRGFLGSFLVEQLRDQGATEPFTFSSEEFDLTHQQEAEALFDKARPELVFHLAATVGGIGANQANPGLYFHANMAMGMNVIEQSRRVGVEKIVFVGTTCSYPKFTPTPFREEELFNGYPEETNAPYGIAKRSLLVMLQAYRRQYGVNGIYLIPANLYGPRDNFDPETSHVIPAMIRKFVEAIESGDSQVTLWGTGEVSREFLYVEDCARAITLAANSYEAEDPVNLGTGDEIKIADLAKKVTLASSYKGKISWDASRPDGQPRRRLDTTKAEKLFAFKATTALDEGLQKTVEWYRANRSKIS